jgi:hypothetical protein
MDWFKEWLKNAARSKTMWYLAIALCSQLAAISGVHLPIDLNGKDAEQAAEALAESMRQGGSFFEVITIIALAGAGHGRTVAKGPLVK